jgi:hypothetical protein
LINRLEASIASGFNFKFDNVIADIVFACLGGPEIIIFGKVLGKAGFLIG